MGRGHAGFERRIVRHLTTPIAGLEHQPGHGDVSRWFFSGAFSGWSHSVAVELYGSILGMRCLDGIGNVFRFISWQDRKRQ